MRLLKSAGDVRIESAVVGADNADTLHYRTCRNTATAKNALVVVAYYR